jgi:isoprenylcysteine carboxyl methyltransferase (ICMT) family protein YpbQ
MISAIGGFRVQTSATSIPYTYRGENSTVVKVRVQSIISCIYILGKMWKTRIYMVPPI